MRGAGKEGPRVDLLSSGAAQHRLLDSRLSARDGKKRAPRAPNLRSEPRSLRYSRQNKRQASACIQRSNSRGSTCERML